MQPLLMSKVGTSCCTGWTWLVGARPWAPKGPLYAPVQHNCTRYVLRSSVVLHTTTRSGDYSLRERVQPAAPCGDCQVTKLQLK